MKAKMVVGMAAVLLTTGCGASEVAEAPVAPEPAPTVTVTATATATPVREVEAFTPTSLEDLREQLTEVGLDCEEWQEVLVDDVAAQCDDIILATFVEEGEAQQNFLQETAYQTWTAARDTEERDIAVLLGTNYSVRMYFEQAEVLQPFLGGVILA